MNDTSRSFGAPDPELPAAVAFDPRAPELPRELRAAAADAPLVVLLDAAEDRGWAADAAIALASIWARAGRRIVLADLHLEDPVLHERVGEPNLDGVVDIFLYGASVARSARPPRGHEFFLIPAGTYTASPEDVYGHSRWKKLVAGFREADASLLVFVPAGARGIDELVGAGRGMVLLGRPADAGALRIGGDEVRAVLVPPTPEPSSGAEREAASVLPDAAQPPEPADGPDRHAEPEPEPPAMADDFEGAYDAYDARVEAPEASITEPTWAEAGREPGGPERDGPVPARADDSGAGLEPGAQEPERNSEAYLAAWSGAEAAPAESEPAAPVPGAAAADALPPSTGLDEDVPAFSDETDEHLPMPPEASAAAVAASAPPPAVERTPARPPPVAGPSRRRHRSGPGPMIWLLVLVGLLIITALVVVLVRQDLFQAVGFGGGAAGGDTRASAAIPPPPAAPVPVGDTLSFAVQVRAYASLDPARTQVERQGSRVPETAFYVVPELTQGVLYYKVMAGMLADTGAATQLRRRLVEAGVVAAEDARDDGSGAWSLIQARPLSFHLGEYPDRGEAQAHADSLAARGIPAYPAAFPYSDGTERYRLYAGAYADSAQAEELRRMLRAQELPARLVTRIGRAPSITQ